MYMYQEGSHLKNLKTKTKMRLQLFYRYLLKYFCRNPILIQGT